MVGIGCDRSQLCPQSGKEKQIGSEVGVFSYSLFLVNLHLLKMSQHSKAVPPPCDQEFNPRSLQGTSDIETTMVCIISHSLGFSETGVCVALFCFHPLRNRNRSYAKSHHSGLVLRSGAGRVFSL